ncbi:MAG: hypothetical protein R3B57_13235 [Phycisphaerales bacterium]
MRRLASFALVLLALVFALVITGCEGTASEADDGSGASSKDKNELRIVALSPAIAHMLVELGLEDKIVGRHDWDLVLRKDVPAVGSQDGIDYEALLRTNPTDILLEWGSRPLPQRLTSLAAEHGWTVRNYGSLLTLDDMARTLDDLDLTYAEPFEKRPESVGVKNAADLDPTTRFERPLPSERLAQAWRDRGPAVRRAGRVLLLGMTDPPSAMGPGSFHQQILERLGGLPAITDGAAWQELDAEDVLRLAPDAIVLVLPRTPSPDEAFEAPATPTADDLIERLGAIGRLDIPAIHDKRVALIDNPLAHLPSTSMADFADELASILERWGKDAPGVP